MNITNAKYTVNGDGDTTSICATVDGKEVHIPIDATNRHYTEIMRQVDAGTLTIADAD
jgi:hypothetical protein